MRRQQDKHRPDEDHGDQAEQEKSHIVAAHVGLSTIAEASRGQHVPRA